jgi:CRP-like cAMP-binding protein
VNEVNPSQNVSQVFKDLTAGSDSEFFSPGSYLMHQGDEAGFAFLIRKGSVQIEHLNLAEQSFTNRESITRSAGDLVGELSLFSKVRSASIRAIAPVECVRISHTVLLQVVTNTPAVALSLLAIVMKKAQEN